MAGLQPGYLPWLGFFDQMRSVDLFVIADEMPFTSTGWTHRNRVRTANGEAWLRLPTRRARGRRIDEVEIDATEPWQRTHLRTLRQAYAASPHAAEEIDRLEASLDPSATRLVDVVVPSLLALADRLAITTPVVRSSEAGLEQAYVERFPDQPGPTHRIIAFLQELGADTLLEGEAGRSYLDVDLCREHGIAVEFQDYEHPRYEQLHGPFVSHLSVVDLLLTHGAERAADIVRTAGTS